MAAPSYQKQLEDAKEALSLIVSGQLASHSTLAGQFSHLSINDLRNHIEWLEGKDRQEKAENAGRGVSYVAFSTASGRSR